MIRSAALAVYGFSSGIVVSAGVFAFIAAIGIVPRLAKRTKTQRFIPFYEDVITVGGLFGTTAMFIDYRLPPLPFLAVAFALFTGVFVGVLAVALAEVLNVMPVMLRRTRLTRGLPWLLMAFALGKTAGSLAYFLVNGFYVI